MVGDDGLTPYERIKGRAYNGLMLEFGSHVLYKLSARVDGGVMEPRWESGVWLGKMWGTEEHMIALKSGVVVKSGAQQPDGATCARRSRERAAPKPAAAPRVSASTAAGAVPAAAIAYDVAAPARVLRPVTAMAKAAGWLHRRGRQDDRAATDRRVQEIGAAAVATPGRPTGAERIAGVMKRVRARLE